MLLDNRCPAEIWLSDAEFGTTLNHLGRQHEGEGPPLTPALLWLTKPSAIFKQIPNPAPCVITAFTHAATSDKGDESVAHFLGNAVHESCFTDAYPPNKTVSAGILKAHTKLAFPISKQIHTRTQIYIFRLHTKDSDKFLLWGKARLQPHAEGSLREATHLHHQNKFIQLGTLRPRGRKCRPSICWIRSCFPFALWSAQLLRSLLQDQLWSCGEVGLQERTPEHRDPRPLSFPGSLTVLTCSIFLFCFGVETAKILWHCK